MMVYKFFQECKDNKKLLEKTSNRPNPGTGDRRKAERIHDKNLFMISKIGKPNG